MPLHFPSPLLRVFDRSWRQAILPNGLRIVHIPLERDERFHLAVTLKVGSRFEKPQQSGISHFLEHMMFRGSRTHPSFAALAKAFEWLGGEWNAATGYEHTEYWYRGHRATAPEIIALFRDFLFHPRLQDIEVERDVIQRELMKEYNEHHLPTDLDHLSLAQMWPGSGLAQPILGLRETIASFRKSELEAYRQIHYQPQNMVLCAVGGRADEMLIEQLSAAFSGYSGGKQRAKVALAPVAFKGPALNWVLNPDNEYQVQLSFRTAGEFSRDAYPLQVLCRILSDGFSSRLAARLREELGLVYDIDATANLFSDVGSIDITSGVGPEQLITYFRELFRLLQNIAAKGPTAEEMERTQRRALMELEMVPAEPEVLAYRLGTALLRGKTPSLERSAKRLMKVDAAGVQRVAQKTFTPQRLSLVVLGPANKALQGRVEALITKMWASLR